MARIINRISPEILIEAKANVRVVTIGKRHIFFNKTLSVAAKMNSDKYVHFINDGDYWAFYLDADPDGFKLTRDKYGCYRINNLALVEMFKKTIGRNVGDRLAVRPSKSEKQGSIVYEIYTKATLEQLAQSELKTFVKRKKLPLKTDDTPFITIQEIAI
jgi:hypothetical protein